MTILEYTEKLCAVHAPSGREQKLAALIGEMLAPLADEWYIDNVGNVVSLIRGTGEKKKKLLFAAHMDEVAFIVTKIDGSGYVHFTNVGGPNGVSSAFREVVFENGTEGFLVPPGNGSLDFGSMVVDIGAKDQAEAETMVSVGDFFAAANGIRKLAGNRIGGRPIDDRIGCAIELSVMERLAEDMKAGKRPYHDVYMAFTVQEEIQLPSMGGSVLTYEVEPDVGLAVDVCQTGDTVGGPFMAVTLGGGASILVRDTTLLAHKDVVDLLTETAKENGIRYQKQVALNGGTDAVPMQKTGRGCRAGVISIPMRYLHTSAEVADLDDADACAELIYALCGRPFAF